MDKEIVSMGNCDDYISAIITDDDYVMDAIGKLRRVYSNILKLEYQNKRTLLSISSDLGDIKVDKMSEIDLFSEFYKKQNGIDMDNDRIKIVNKVILECLDKKE